MIYLILTVICAIFNLLCLVNIQSLAVGFGGLLKEALAKSAEMPYAEIAHSQRSTATSCCVSEMKTCKHASFCILVHKKQNTHLRKSHT